MNLDGLSKEQVGVLSEYIDLLRNHYVHVFEIYQDNFWFIKVRHLTNGRILTLRWRPSEGLLMEGRKIIKQIG